MMQDEIKNELPEQENYEVKEINVEQGKKFSFEDIENELLKPKQPQNTDDDLFGDNDKDFLGDDKDKDKPEENKSENAKRNAEIICKAIDRFGAFGFSIWAKEENSDYFRMKQAELKMLTEEMETTLGDMPDFKMPAYIGLLIVLPVIYMPIFKKAKDLRKLNIEKQKKTNNTPKQNYYKVDDVLPKKPVQQNTPVNNVSDAIIVEEKDNYDIEKERILKPTIRRGRPKGSKNKPRKKK